MSAAAPPFQFPSTYSFPPFFTPQPNSATRTSQLQKWSALVQSWCRHHRTYRLTLSDAIESPLFYNAALRKRLSMKDARDVLDWMTKEEEEGGGGQRAEWLDGSSKNVARIWWKRPEEWAGIVADWVENTGQKNVVLTVYELVEGEGTMSQEWHGMDTDVMLKCLNVLVKRGKAQVFGGDGQEGVKFF
ncbi:ESCRT-II subunit protein VPS25 [Aspergillus saccharolyticus JOP 1030-1]|uniref:Vacuolar protein-sorting-associated protein 25 n=1 Tax=Aspergillus saccharolyticus JOP 1030-1 TaxID=1450539 RepID=A0A318ZET1_9EURO|nr:putative ESCRT-II complex component [Aspergillus saccharolyticus JOP 1030-1]PYH42110.1 putative ESCRT-II complex component [Aspergillus saccharolyticus JOP 1030-1]